MSGARPTICKKGEVFKNLFYFHTCGKSDDVHEALSQYFDVHDPIVKGSGHMEGPIWPYFVQIVTYENSLISFDRQNT